MSAVEDERYVGGLIRIAVERQRQVEDEGWTAEHDDQHTEDELAKVAALYAMPHRTRSNYIIARVWPRMWSRMKWWKPSPQDRIKELTKAGALIVAEIDRLERQAHSG
jgi:hypothetical protein